MKKKLIVGVLTAALALGTLTACGSSKDDSTITVAASATPHAEILEQVKEEKSHNIKNNGDVRISNNGINSGTISGINSGDITK